MFRMIKVFLVFLITIIISGCGNRIEIANELNENDSIYSSTDKVIEGINGSLVCSDFRKEYYIITELDDHYFLNIYNSQNEKIEIHELMIDDNMIVRSICVGDEIFVVLSDEKENHYIARYSRSGNEEKAISIDDVSEDGFNRLIADNSGNVYFSNSKKIIEYDSDLNELGVIEERDDRILNAALSSSGDLVAIVEKVNSSGLFFYTDYYIGTVDSKLFKVKDKKKIEGEIAHGKILIDSDNLSCCIRMEDGIYTLEDNSIIKKLDYSYSLLTMDDTERFISLNDDVFSVIISNDDNCVIRTYTKGNLEDIANKEIITFGCFGKTENIEEVVVDFNRNNHKYFVKIIDYGSDQDGAKKFNLDIANGTGPDIFDVGGYQSIDKLIQKGLCENLNPYFEQDEEIDKADLIDEYVKATEYDGKTYMISDSFMLSTLVTRKNDYLTEYNCNYDELNEYINNSGSGTRLLYCDLPKIDLFALYVEGAIKYYIDYEKGESHFNTTEFKKLMKLCNDQGVSEEGFEIPLMSDIEIINAYRNGEALFLPDPSPNNMKQIEKMFGDDICICGYPDMGSFFRPINEICMNSKSDKKYEAWIFLRTILSTEYQAGLVAYNGEIIPTRKDAYEALKKRLSSKEDYVDEFGNEIKALDEPIDDKYLDKYDEMIYHTDKYIDLNLDLEKVMFEEAASYFTGEHELDVSVELMDNRVNTYLKEHK